MSKAGEKRGGDNEEKKFTDEQVASLEAPNKKLQRIEIAADRYRHKLLAAEYVERDKVADAIPGFWRQALQNSVALLQLSAIEEDQKALSFLSKIRAWRDPEQIQAFGIELHFESNPFFTNSVLRKEFKYVAPTDPEALKKDDLGVSEADLEFNFERDVDAVPTKIEWKDATKNLTKLYPRIFDPEDDTDVQEPGSFFNIFESTKVTRDVYEAELVEIYENAIEFFLNRAEGSVGEMMAHDSDEEDEEDDDSDEEDIDLENPKKKAKK